MTFTARFRAWSLSTVCIAVLALTACGGRVATAPATQPPASASLNEASPEPVASAPTSAATAACETLKPAFAEALGLQVAVTETTFTDIAGGMQRQGCQLTVKGTGVQIEDFIGVSQQLSTLLTSKGWGEAQPLADGPTGTVIGFNGGGALGQLTIEWKPAQGADCPQDRPVSDCTLAPEQKLYTIKLEAAAT